MTEETGLRWGTTILLTVTGLIVGGLIGRLGLPLERGTPITVSTPAASQTPPVMTTVALLRVYVCGAVQHPDVYSLPPGSIVQDGLIAAGGPAPDADLNAINLALELQDQQRVYIPHEGETVPPSAPGDDAAVGLININSASAAELETLPRIGPVTAADIIAYREANGPFGAIEEIENVPGIGPATFEQIRELITVR